MGNVLVRLMGAFSTSAPAKTFRYVLLIGVVFVAAFHPASGNACELRVRIFTFPPQAMQDSHGNWYGMDVDYTRALLKQAGCQAKFINVPWGRGLKLMSNGQLDLMLNMTELGNRRNYIDFIGPQRTEVIHLVSRKNAIPPISTWKQMDNLHAALVKQRGTYLGDKMTRVLKHNPTLEKAMIPLANNKNRIEMVSLGRADGFFADETLLNYEKVHNPDFKNLRIHPLIISKQPVYFGLSKKSVSPELVKKLTKAYQQLAQQGMLKRIERKYRHRTL